MSGSTKILVVDDEHSVRWAFEKALQKAGYQVALAENGVKGLDLYKSFQPDVVLVDIRMPEMDGLELLKQIRALDSDAQVIVMTAYTDMETTVQAMKLGAYDFLSKPFNIDECLLLISRGANARRLESKPEIAAQAPKASALKGNSPAMQEVYKLIGKVSQEDITVLVTGESGSGKELVAQAIHYNSDRSSNPFWAINCTAINESLMESELFGYEKGAFTGAQNSKQGMFELAQGGTIFLDEIGDMNLEMQAKLLRVLEEREIVRVGGNKRISVDVRIIAATNKDLRKAIVNNTFREDLYHRIKVIEIKLPPLRERPDDIPLLARYFCSILASNRKGSPKTLAKDTLEILSNYNWPGNVRELRNVIEQAYTLSRDHIILPEHLPAEVRSGKVSSPARQETPAIIPAAPLQPREPESKSSIPDNAPVSAGQQNIFFTVSGDSSAASENTSVTESREQTIQPAGHGNVDELENVIKKLVSETTSGQVFAYVTDKIEKELLRQCLEINKWNQVQTAVYLGITRNTLRSKIEKLKLNSNLGDMK